MVATVVVCAWLSVFAWSASASAAEGAIETRPVEVDLGSLLDLDPEVVTASKRKESISVTPAIISAWGADQIDLLPLGNLGDLMNLIPGVETSMGPDGSIRVSVRGGQKDGTVLFLLNGHPFNESFTGAAYFELPLDLIERIEVVRGPGSALFGTNGVYGVVNVILRKGIKRARATAGAEGIYGVAGAYDLELGEDGWEERTDSLSVLQVTEHPRLSFFASFDSNAAGGQPISSDKSIDYSTAPEWNPVTQGTGETNYSLQNIYATANFDYGNTSAVLAANVRNQQPWTSISEILSPGTEFSRTVLSGSVAHRVGFWEDVFELKGALHGDLILHDDLLQSLPAGFFGSDDDATVFTDGQLLAQKYNNYVVGADLESSVMWGEHFDAIVGATAYQHKVVGYTIERNYRMSDNAYIGEFGSWDEGTTAEQDDLSRDILAGYAQVRLRGFGGNLVAGTRYEKYSDFGSTVSPRVGLTWNLFDTVYLKALMGQAFRAPTLREIHDPTPLISGGGTKANDELVPETIETKEFGIEFNHWQSVLRANYFVSLNENVIGPYDSGSRGAGRWSNLGIIKSKGYEIEFQTQLIDGIRLFSNYANYEPTFEWNLDVLSTRSYKRNYGEKWHDIRHQPTKLFNCGFLGSYGDLSGSLSFAWRAATKHNLRLPIEELHPVIIPESNRMNVAMSYRVRDGLKVKLTGTNVLGDWYSAPSGENGIDVWGENGLIQPGTQFFVSVSYER